MKNKMKKPMSASVTEEKKEEACQCKKEGCHCSEGCHCGEDCHCGEGCSCGCHCGCDCKKMLVKSGVTLFSAIIIAGAILTAGTDFIGSCGKSQSAKAPRAGLTNAIIQDYIQKNPKVILDSVDAYYKKQQKGAAAQPKAPQKADKALIDEIVNDKTNYVLGNPNGKYVIIEFFDYGCGWCKKTNQELWAAINTPEGKNIRWILIDTPIFGDASRLVSQYVLAAGKQGKFKEMHHAVVTSGARPNETKLKEIAKGLGLDVKKLEADAKGEEIKKKLDHSAEYAQKLRFGGVPYLIVNGNINPGALIGDRLKEAVKESNK